MAAPTVTNLLLQTSSNTGIPIGIDEKQKTFDIYFTFQVAAGTYAAGGFPFDLTQLWGLATGGVGSSMITSANPLKVVFESAHSTTTPQTGLFAYNYAPGTTQANGNIQIFGGAAANSPLAEISNGAVPAGVLADTIQGVATFPKL